jgi:predicted phage terminase large subunit-like protein
MCSAALKAGSEKLGKDLGKITAEWGTFAYAQVRLSTERTNYIYIWCWSRLTAWPACTGNHPKVHRVRDEAERLMRKRLGYPELKRAVREQAEAFGPQTILIEDRASGTQLIQELVGEGMYAIKSYEPAMDKIMRMNSVTSTIENGFVHLPDKACWLAEYTHELITFPKAKNDESSRFDLPGLGLVQEQLRI